MTFLRIHPALSFCLSMISAQTLRVCPEGKPVPTRRVVARGHAFPDHALSEGRPAEKPDSSFGLDVGCLDDRPPSFRFGLLERTQGFGRLLRERRDLDTEFVEALAHHWIRKNLHHRG